MRVMKGSLSTKISAFPPSIITGCAGTLTEPCSSGWHNEAAPAKGWACLCIQSVGMVYQSGNTGAAQQQGARSLQAHSIP
uniref:Uncharacterized protein n=1 Tax=Geospiza parvula TaxID=87175 RepID=A0A8C3M8J5_GEOPR